ncbi:mRNA export factor-like [Sycon ciliatum]|uniref:mRNA export factor-like n=1 Tax=Sycon ciliatum TaxID=27933 RepID=UPI0020ADE098|eukprot:scpid83603/ scgid23887/ mRNA export factor; Rae1 protein homolog; mRNA-associated protein mrnp 41
MFSNAQNTNQPAANPLKDLAFPQGPSDSISNIEFSPKADLLVGSSWDNTVRCWNVDRSAGISMLGQQSHDGPVLDCAWHPDGSKVFTGSADKTAKIWDLQANQSMAVAQHDGPIKSVKWIQAPGYQCLMTGSWDKTLKFWDTRSPQPVLSFQLPERCYGADVVYPLAVVITAGHGVHCYQLGNQPSYVKAVSTILSHQLRCVAICCDKTNGNPIGMALGCIEGRVAIEYPDSGQQKTIGVSGKPENTTFQFKCHRQTEANSSVQDIYAVHCIKFHPVHRGLFATCGADGMFNYWDKDARVKLTQSVTQRQPSPVTAGCFNARGDFFAYATGYDWSKGHAHTSQNGYNVYLRQCDIQPSSSNKGRK